MIWAADPLERLSPDARALNDDPANTSMFSVVSIWEVVIKNGRGRPDFAIDARRFRSGLLAAGYRELEVTADHVLAVGQLAPLHRDPFDRLLIAQAETEGALLLTADRALVGYAGPVRFVG